MARKFLNNYSTTITTTIFGGDVTVSVFEPPPALAAGDYYIMTLTDFVGNPTKSEIIKVTAVSGNELTIERGLEGTTPEAFAAPSAVIELRATADAFARLDGTEITRYVETTKLDATSIINRADGGIQKLTLVGDSTISFVMEEGESITLHLLNWATYNITWSGVTWIGGGAPITVTNADVLTAWRFDGVTYVAYGGYY